MSLLRRLAVAVLQELLNPERPASSEPNPPPPAPPVSTPTYIDTAPIYDDDDDDQHSGWGSGGRDSDGLDDDDKRAGYTADGE